jgi:hypothetical protein
MPPLGIFFCFSVVVNELMLLKAIDSDIAGKL